MKLMKLITYQDITFVIVSFIAEKNAFNVFIWTYYLNLKISLLIQKAFLILKLLKYFG